jgi:hypothetical protein
MKIGKFMENIPENMVKYSTSFGKFTRKDGNFPWKDIIFLG